MNLRNLSGGSVLLWEPFSQSCSACTSFHGLCKQSHTILLSWWIGSTLKPTQGLRLMKLSRTFSASIRVSSPRRIFWQTRCCWRHLITAKESQDYSQSTSLKRTQTNTMWQSWMPSERLLHTHHTSSQRQSSIKMERLRLISILTSSRRQFQSTHSCSQTNSSWEINSQTNPKNLKSGWWL